MPLDIRKREGFALATAIVAIVLIGLLIAASFFASFQAYRTGRNTLYQERALAIAEYGQGEVLRTFDVTAARAMKVGDVVTRTVNVHGGGNASLDITKLNMLTFWVVSQGRAAAGTDMDARRRTGMLIRLQMPELRIQGALTTASTTNVTGTGSMNGNDLNPAGWQCDELGPPRAGVVNDVPADVTSGGTCSGFSCVTGTPQVAQDPLAGDPSTYDEFGGISYDSLAALASITIPYTTVLGPLAPAVSGGVCNKAVVTNWGDILRNAVTPGPCETYFPIIHVTGTGEFRINSGTGQGILLVDGSLRMMGNVEFYGPIIIKGSFSTQGTGNKVFGGVMAGNQGCSAATCNSVSGNAHIQFSRCSLLSALIAQARPVLATRSWADMF